MHPRPARLLQRILLPVALVGLSSVVPAQTCSLVKDINQQGPPIDSKPAELVQVGGWSYFSAATYESGRELWRTQGTAASTQLVKDIVPGPSSSVPSGLVACGNYVYFSALVGGSSGTWRSDGTVAGTRLVLGGRATARVCCNGKVFQTTNVFVSSQNRFQLWVIEGTTVVRSRKVFEIALDPFAIGTSDLVCFGNRVFFTLPSGFSPHPGLYVSDGARTSMVSKMSASGLTVCNGAVFFAGSTGTAGQELWRSDGTTARMVKDINPGTGSSSPGNFVCCNGTLYFRASAPGTGGELWKSDGSTAGTVLVADIVKGSGSSSPASLSCCNKKVFFTARGSSGTKPYVTDGTAAGTVKLSSTVSVFGKNPFLCCGTHVFFPASDTAGTELWISDGTPAGTRLVKDIRSPGSSSPAMLGCIGATALFSANDGITGIELWRSDGSARGTNLLRDIAPGLRTGSASVSGLTTCGGTLLFRASDGKVGSELWKTDGFRNTTLVKDIYPGARGGAPRYLTCCGDRVVFAASTPTSGGELWITDGNSSGTKLLKDIRTGTASSNPFGLVCCGNTVFFFADDGTSGVELWKSDGTTAGTVQVKDINPSGSGIPRFQAAMVCCKSLVLFPANDGKNGTEVWRSDGTAAGTFMLKNISPTSSSSPAGLTCIDGVVWFSANDGTHGTEVWRSDGTATATTMLKDINPGTASSNPAGFTKCGSKVYMRALTVTRGSELWSSDGTAQGTIQVADMFFGRSSSSPGNLTCIGSKLVFHAYDGRSRGQHGSELWSYDVTSRRATLVKDISPGSSSSSPGFPGGFLAVGNQAYFSARSPSHGTELWRTNGVGTGTVEVCDLNPLSSSSSPRDLTLFAGRLFFAANSGKYGVELFRIGRPGAHVATLAPACPPLRPTLSATLPLLGKTLTFSGASAAANYFGVLAIGLPSRRPIAVPTRCFAYTSPSAFVIANGLLAHPAWTLPIPIPNSPALDGLGLVGQAWWFRSSPNTPFALTNALLLGFGTF